MKKSILALLMLVCLCTLFSCGGGSGELAKFSKSLKKAEPKAVVSTITVTSADGSQVLDMTASVSDGNDNAATLDMDYYPLFGFDENGNAVIPNGVTEEMNGSAAVSSAQQVMLGELHFHKSFFKDEAYILDETRFYAVISDIPGFFGTEIEGISEVVFQIDLDARSPVAVKISYETAEKNLVRIDMTVRY